MDQLEPLCQIRGFHDGCKDTVALGRCERDCVFVFFDATIGFVNDRGP